jgi:hypothetical protein
MPSKTDTKEYLLLLLILALGVILILVSANQKSYWTAVSSELGNALIIAALVGIFVEMSLFKAAIKRLEDVGTQLLGDIKGMVAHTLRKYVPTRQMDAMVNQALDPVFLREEINILITLRYEPDKQRVKGTVGLKYYVRNLTSKPQTYMVRLYLDEVFGEKSAGLDAVLVEGKEINLSVLPQGTKISRDSNLLKFEHPVSIPAENRLYVEIGGYQLMDDEDVWPWHLMGVSYSATCTVNYPPALTVWLLTKHPASNETDHETANNLGTVQAKIKDIILPYQGFELRWKLTQEILPTEQTIPSGTAPA